MLKRKFAAILEDYVVNGSNKIMLVNGARQIGKSYIIRYVCHNHYKHYVEINLKHDAEGPRMFASVKSAEDFYLQLGASYGSMLGGKEDTIIFLDEIQSYPHLLTLLKFLNADGKYRYVASGSLLGVALAQTPSIPIGSIIIKQMYPMDFEEFLWATGSAESAIEQIRGYFINKESLSDSLHNYLLRQLKVYLLTGGMPDAINEYLATRNIAKIRMIQSDIHELYKLDASQYELEKKLVIRKLYEMIPSNMENKKKRVIVKNIENTGGHKQYSDYADEFEYLTNSGIALSVQAISNPKFPLMESESKNLVKLYLSDVGLLTNLLYGNNINAILNEEKSINMGSVYETLVAQELMAHGFKLHYYDNKQKGEVDFLIDDYRSLSVVPIEVKSGKDYTVHSALNNFLSTPDYHIHKAIVFGNAQDITESNGILYMPIYYVMFLSSMDYNAQEVLIPDTKQYLDNDE